MPSWRAVGLLLVRWLPLRQRWGMVQLIALLSVLGIGIGTATLLSVLSIFKGFHHAVQELLLRYDPHVRIAPTRGQWFWLSPDSAAYYARVVDARAALLQRSGRVVVQRGEALAPATLVTAPEQAVRQATGIEQSLLVGQFTFRVDGQAAVVVGTALAERLRLLPGDTLWVWTPAMVEELALGLRIGSGIAVVVAGIFQAPSDAQQGFALYGDTALGRLLFRTPAQAWSALDLWLATPEATPKAVRVLRQHLPSWLQPIPWYELHRQLYDVLRLERLATFAVLSLIVLVAVFTIAASLRMSVLQKRRDIALVRALGARAGDIERLYLGQGALLGSLGVLLGMLGGLGFYTGQQHFGWIRLDPTRYILSALPVFLELWDVVAVCGTAFALVLLAAFWPARWAARQPIAAGLREE